MADFFLRAPRPGETFGAYTAAMQAAGVPAAVAAQVFGGARPSNLTVFENDGTRSTPAAVSPTGLAAQRPASPAPAAPAPSIAAGNLDPANLAAWQQAQNATNAVEKQKLELKKQAAADAHQKALQDLQLATTADQRAQALLALQQSQQELSRLQFEESKRQFDAQHGLAQQQFGEQAREFDVNTGLRRQDQFSNLAQALLQGASALRGPADWMQYQRFISGGRSLVDQLYSDQPRAVGAAPVGENRPVDLADILGRLGLMGGQAAAPAGQAQPGMRAVQGAPDQRTGINVPGFGAIPFGHQLNPAVYDKLGGVGQQLLKGLVEAGGQDFGTYTAEMNATRPMGTAQRATRTAYQPSQGFF
jgi:hypothetical protein